MLRQTFLTGLGVMIIVGVFFLASCSDDDQAKNASVVNEIIDTAANKVADALVEATFAAAEGEITNDTTISEFGDAVINEPYLYVTFNGGLISYDMGNDSINMIRNGRKLNALAYHNGLLYVGGDGLFIAREDYLEPVDIDIEGNVTSLLSDSERLIIGTDCGLYSKSIFGLKPLFDDISVTALEFDDNGLWVGSDGQGLYHWDGEEFKKRFLLRDTSIFDYVNDIDFNHGHIYLAATTGFFIFDGGRWEQWTSDMGLPANEIKSIDASDWMVHLGTVHGVIAYFNKNLYPVKKLESVPADLIRLNGKDIIIVNSEDGLIMKSGMVVKTLIESVRDKAEEDDPDIFTQAESDEEI